MKNSVLIIVFIILSNLVFSQNNNDLIKESEFIFKGVMIKKTPFKEKNNDPFFIYTIKIDTVYKGYLTSGNVNIVAKSPIGWTNTSDGYILYNHICSDYASIEDEKKAGEKGIIAFAYGGTGVFVCNVNNDTCYNLPVVSSDNKILLMPICKINTCYFRYFSSSYIDKQSNKYISRSSIEGFGYVFSSWSEFEMKLNDILYK